MLVALAALMVSGMTQADLMPDSLKELSTDVKNNTGMPIFFSWRSKSTITRGIEKLIQKVSAESYTLVEAGKTESKAHTGDKLYVMAYTCPGYKKIEAKYRPVNKGYESITVKFDSKKNEFMFEEK